MFALIFLPGRIAGPATIMYCTNCRPHYPREVNGTEGLKRYEGTGNIMDKKSRYPCEHYGHKCSGKGKQHKGETK